MKILVVHGQKDIVSGAEYAIIDFLNNYDSFDVVHYVPGKGLLGKFLTSRGQRVYERLYSSKRRKYPGLYLLSSLLFAFYLKKENYDLIILNTLYSGNRVAFAARLASVPYLIWIREYGDLGNRHYKRLLYKADRILAVSNDVKKYYYLHAQKTVVVHDIMNRLDIERIQSYRLTESNSDNKKNFQLLYMGRITAYKQLDKLLSSLLLRRNPEISLYIAGDAVASEANYKRRILKLVEECQEFGLNVVYLGQVEENWKLIAQSDLLVVPSNREPYPRVITEAQLIGTLVLASDTGGCPEMIADEKTGFLYNQASAQDLSDKIEYIFRLEQERKIKLIRQGIDAAETRNLKGESLLRFNEVINTIGAKKYS